MDCKVPADAKFLYDKGSVTVAVSGGMITGAQCTLKILYHCFSTTTVHRHISSPPYLCHKLLLYIHFVCLAQSLHAYMFVTFLLYIISYHSIFCLSCITSHVLR